MKRITLGMAVVGLLGLVVSAGGVTAAPPDAADLAADCNDDGVVTPTGDARYVGGTGELVGNCAIVVPAGSRLVLRGVELSGADAFVVRTESTGGAGATVRVVNSTFDFGSFVEFTPGANAGDPGVPDGDITLSLRRTKIRAAGIILATSLDWPSGRTIVGSSDLTATSGGISIESSELGGVDGTTRVVRSTLTAATDIGVSAGPDGRTVVRNNTVSAGGSTIVTVGAGGRCATSGNTPPLVCT